MFKHNTHHSTQNVCHDYNSIFLWTQLSCKCYCWIPFLLFWLWCVYCVCARTSADSWCQLSSSVGFHLTFETWSLTGVQWLGRLVSELQGSAWLLCRWQGLWKSPALCKSWYDQHSHNSLPILQPLKGITLFNALNYCLAKRLIGERFVRYTQSTESWLQGWKGSYL